MTTVRILIVTDEGGGFHRSNTRVFHVGEFVQVLRNTVWEGFGIEITQAHRDGDDASQFSGLSLAHCDGCPRRNIAPGHASDDR